MNKMNKMNNPAASNGVSTSNSQTADAGLHQLYAASGEEFNPKGLKSLTGDHTSIADMEKLYEHSQLLRLPRMCYQFLSSAEQPIPVNLYKDILNKTGILIISLTYKEKTSESLERVINTLGTPHTHSIQEDVIWHVKQGGLSGNEALALTHKLGEFAFHTDCSYEQHVPDYFGLYCVVHDRLGGGKNLLIDGLTLIQHLTLESLEMLQNELVEIRVPPEFKKRIESIRANIIDKNFNVRYRKDILNEYNLTLPLKKALAEFDSLCHSPILTRSLELKAGQILIVNNRRYLHARTSIKDKERHLIRIRFFAEFTKFKE